MAVITTTCTNTENTTSPGTQTSTTSASPNGTSTTSTSTSSGTNTTNTSTTTTTTDNISIINTLLADISAVIPNYASLVASYRLLVGAAEEIQRTPGVPFEIFERAVIRYDRTGTLIDMLNELLCCKIAFSTELLSITCAPIDIVKLLTDCISPCAEDQCTTAEQVVVLEALRQTLFRRCNDASCFGPPPAGIKPPPPPAPPAAPPAAKPPPVDVQSDLETTEELETEASIILPKFKSPLARKHI
ncbi:hypothetical protein [Sporomusa malonica]|uniref:Uncharacterized protein n=1 Tax=Sporomusa malonica TaxID=112901 RepID=A0A1W2DG06_9FIRM|nr:hypothetical protein [Sporomusa malonica]SMC95896.1 hypothetical protein SAMN04488500_11564 [Sporomusa malonica]